MERSTALLLAITTLLSTSCLIGCSDGQQKTVSEQIDSEQNAAVPKRSPNPIGPEIDSQSVTASESPHTKPTGENSETDFQTVPRLSFKNVAPVLGISHTYNTGAIGELLMVESIGGGAGWLDFDHDGKLDLFCVQGGDATAQDTSVNDTDALFRQRPAGTMTEVTNECGIRDQNYSQGTVIADFDNDGFPDVFVTNVGKNQLFHNSGDGTFILVENSACGLAQMWSSSAAWFDADKDGDLDLYVCNYLKYDPHAPLLCEKNGQPALCHPRQLEHWPDEFFENCGDGSFRECAAERGLIGKGNKSLGVAAADFSGDGWPDLYVANDTTANFYFVNQQDGTFRETSLELGGGINAGGAMQASMGVAAADFDRTGTIDLLLTHFTGESNTLYQNLAHLGLYDKSGRTGLFSISMSKLGFGTVMVDFDCNGQMDAVVANGHIDSVNADGDGFQQQPQTMSFDGDRWLDTSQGAGEYFSEKHVGRAVAAGDYDFDGDVDLAIVHQNEPLAILENQSSRGRWLKIVPISILGNRSGIGVKATVRIGGEQWSSTICGGTSFCASHEHSLFFGFGEADSPAEVTIDWPGSGPQLLDGVALDQTITVREP